MYRSTLLLPLTCPKCQKALTVRLRLPGVAEDTRPTQQTLVCPYAACGVAMQPALHGKIEAVWQGHGPEAGEFELPRRPGASESADGGRSKP